MYTCIHDYVCIVVMGLTHGVKTLQHLSLSLSTFSTCSMYIMYIYIHDSGYIDVVLAFIDVYRHVKYKFSHTLYVHASTVIHLLAPYSVS